MSKWLECCCFFAKNDQKQIKKNVPNLKQATEESKEQLISFQDVVEAPLSPKMDSNPRDTIPVHPIREAITILVNSGGGFKYN